MAAIGERIKTRREELGMTQDELAKKLGYKSRSTVNKIEMGINDINQSKIVAFAKALNTTTAYLMGWGDFTEDEQKAAEIAAEVTLSKELQEIIAAYRKLSDADKKTVYNLIQSLANR